MSTANRRNIPSSSRESASHAAAADSIQSDRLLSLKQVEPLVGLKRSAIDERVRDGRMPQPLKLSSRCTRWRLSEIQAWIAQQGKPQ